MDAQVAEWLARRPLTNVARVRFLAGTIILYLFVYRLCSLIMYSCKGTLSHGLNFTNLLVAPVNATFRFLFRCGVIFSALFCEKPFRVGLASFKMSVKKNHWLADHWIQFAIRLPIIPCPLGKISFTCQESTQKKCFHLLGRVRVEFSLSSPPMLKRKEDSTVH